MSNLATVIAIVPRLPPAIDGVGDYALSCFWLSPLQKSLVVRLTQVSDRLPGDQVFRTF
ncbi:MAG: hypothetical protein H9536_10655 [Aphanizomenon flos-aquae Clear-A1]|jgi:hypothetical protein|nr:hypothetical protein [Aphanizomenon flos-aquae Clear-A1]